MSETSRRAFKPRIPWTAIKHFNGNSEQAILRAPGGSDGRLPSPRVEPAAAPSAVSAIFCRRRANAGYTGRAQWNEDYRRCMAGY